MILDKSQIVYRKIKPNEINLLIEYRIKFLSELQGNHSVEKENELREELTDYFGNAFMLQSFIGWLAEWQGEPIGFGAMVVQRIPGHFRAPNGKIGYILNMYTLPKYRKNGICNILLDKLINEGKELGLAKLNLHASNDGIELYKKKGFVGPELPELELKL